LSFVAAASAIAALSISANAQLDPKFQKRLPHVGQGIPLGHEPMLKPVCHPDPAITGVMLTKGSAPLQVQISYTITNVASSAWHSGTNQQNVTLTAHNANTNHTFTDTRPLPGDAAGGAQMLNFTTPMIDGAFDNFEFGGFLDLRISYDPDILLDSNPCNNDANLGNNHFRLENSQILGFMKGTARSQTFHP
jgi:hypothetical protein